MDQTGLELMRATGRDQLIQCVWVYEHPIDMHGLERFHRNVAASYGNRLVERSPLPFGRPRWVRGDRSQVPIRVEARPRPRDELIDWADELASLPIDPEHGPCWRLVVQPLTDGSTAVSMFGSHVIADGVGAIRLVKDATEGRRRNPGYLSHGARPALRGIASDLHQAVRDVPETIRVLARASAFVYRSRREIARAVASKPVADVAPQPTVVVPAIAIFIDGDEWDRRAKHLGGNSYSLLAAFAAKLGERMGRQRATDGAVTLIIAINVRESDEVQQRRGNDGYVAMPKVVVHLQPGDMLRVPNHWWHTVVTAAGDYTIAATIRSNSPPNLTGFGYGILRMFDRQYHAMAKAFATEGRIRDRHIGYPRQPRGDSGRTA